MLNKDIIKYLERKLGSEQDYRSHPNRDNRDYRGSRMSRDYNDYEDDYRRGRRSTRDYTSDNEDGRYMDFRSDSEYDGNDYHNYKHLKLSKADIMKAEQKLHNVDGSHGPHYDYQQIMQVAERLGIRFDSFTEKEFCLCVNMMYADYIMVIRKYTPPEKELMCCAEMAKAFFDDPDGPEPSEKLALYFHCIAAMGNA